MFYVELSLFVLKIEITNNRFVFVVTCNRYSTLSEQVLEFYRCLILLLYFGTLNNFTTPYF